MTQEKQTLPEQAQNKQPGLEEEMRPRPQYKDNKYKPAGKLRGKVALITGGDSGIGRAVAVDFAMEGADVAIVYLNEDKDAQETRRQVENQGRKCLLISGDVGDEKFCQNAVKQVIDQFGHLEILVNNAGEQHEQKSIENISADQLERTFRTNIFSQFFLTKSAIQYMKEGSTIINTASITAYQGSPRLMDYASTKGAIVSFTRSLAKSLVKNGIRVNAVAPGPVWTPLIPASFPPDEVKKFGADTPMGRPAEPEEIAPSYVFLASDDSSYMTGEVLHLNGGEFITS